MKGFLRLKLSYEDSQPESLQQAVDQSEANTLPRDQQQEATTSAQDDDNRTEVWFSFFFLIFIVFFYHKNLA